MIKKIIIAVMLCASLVSGCVTEPNNTDDDIDDATVTIEVLTTPQLKPQVPWWKFQ